MVANAILVLQPAMLQGLPTSTTTPNHASVTHHLSACALQIVRMLERIHIYDVLPRRWVFVHTHDGVRAAVAALDDGENGMKADVTEPLGLQSKDVSREE